MLIRIRNNKIQVLLVLGLITLPNDFTLTGFGYQGFEFSSLFQITLSSGTGNTSITCSQSGLSGVLLCNISTSGDPGQNASSYGASKTITHEFAKVLLIKRIMLDFIIKEIKV